MLVVLPARPRRAWLHAFCAALSLWAGFAVGLLAPLDPWGRSAAAALVTVLAVVVGVLRPTELGLVYRVWNKAARGYALVVRAALLALCYGVITAAGTAGSSLRLRRPRPGESLWYPRDTLPAEAYGSLDERPGRAWRGHPWRAVLTWALRTGHAWAIVLLPFLMLIAALERSEQTHYPDGIYTLF